MSKNGMQITHCFNCFGDKRLNQKQYEGVFSSVGTQNNTYADYHE